jgi:hypothetical protein
MYANFTEETCTGTGATLALAGITTGNLPFSTSFSDGERVAYVVEDSGGSIKVAGYGIYVSATDDITRNDTWNYNGTVVDNNPTSNITLSGGTHTIRCDIVNDNTGNYFQNGLATAAKIFTPHNWRFASNGAAPQAAFNEAANRFTVLTCLFYYPTLITSILVDIQTASAGGNLRFGIYSVSAEGGIGNLLADSGDFSTASTGLLSNTLATPLILQKGVYLIGAVADNTTVRTRGVSSNNYSGGGGILGVSTFGNENGSESANSYAHTYGALPTTFGAPALANVSGNIIMPYFR